MSWAMKTTAQAPRTLSEPRRLFASRSLSHATQGRNTQSTLGTRNSLKTHARPRARAERPVNPIFTFPRSSLALSREAGWKPWAFSRGPQCGPSRWDGRPARLGALSHAVRCAPLRATIRSASPARSLCRLAARRAVLVGVPKMPRVVGRLPETANRVESPVTHRKQTIGHTSTRDSTRHTNSRDIFGLNVVIQLELVGVRAHANGIDFFLYLVSAPTADEPIAVAAPEEAERQQSECEQC